MRPLRLLLLTGLLCGLAAESRADDAAQARHPWGRFAVGSWKRTRVRKETYDAGGNLAGSSVEESKTTLLEADARHYTLEVETRIRAAGQDFQAPKKQVALSYYGTLPEQTAEVVWADEEVTLDVAGVPVVTRRLEVRVTTDDLKRVTKMYMADPASSPLRLETVATRPADGSVVLQSQSEVVAMDLLHNLLDEQRTVSLVRTILRRRQTVQRTFEMHCRQVPGAVVASWSTERDMNGRLTERSTLELVDFGVPGDTP